MSQSQLKAQNLLQISKASKSFGLQSLFSDASFSINEGEHVGVIGPNGAGKTTLFKILNKEMEFDTGEIVKSRALRMGYLSQHDTWSPTETGNSYLEKMCTVPVWQAKLMGQELQVSEAQLERPILSLSGGYRMRIKLMGLLGREPNLMMLDEPTNYLDLETTLLLERFLQNYTGAFLLISHDREVLRRTTDHTLEVESGDIIKFSGNIDDYFEQKQMLREQLEAQAQNQAAKKKSIMDFVNRFGAKATKARQAQSRLKMLDKMDTIELKEIPVRSVIKIPPPIHVGKSVLRLQNCFFGYNNEPVLRDITIEILRGDHIAVVGFNGVGKSTLLKGLAGTLAPLSGEKILGYQVDIAIFNQHVTEILNPEHSVFESLEETASKEITSQDIRNMAGSLLFSADHIEKKVKVLSGGEKSRVALGRILLQKVPCLLLDEPTNHLDFETVEALTQALNNYLGTLVVVSHDRSFVRRVGKKILEVSQQKVNIYPGTYDEYVWSLQKRLASQSDDQPTQVVTLVESSTENNPKNSTGKQWKDQAKRLKYLERQIENIEKQIAECEDATVKLNDQISSGQLSPQELALTLENFAQNSLTLQENETLWIASSEELSNLKLSMK